MNYPPLIGLAGHAGSGKDTAAALLYQFGYSATSFADPIKHVLNERFGWTSDMWNDRIWKETPQERYGQKTHAFSPRSWAQWLGTEVGRNLFGPDAWVNLLFRTLDNTKLYVIPDVRFASEAEAIREQGGVIIRLHRASAPAIIHHVSETPLPDELVDHEIDNNGEIHDLFRMLLSYLNDYTRSVAA